MRVVIKSDVVKREVIALLSELRGCGVYDYRGVLASPDLERASDEYVAGYTEAIEDAIRLVSGTDIVFSLWD